MSPFTHSFIGLFIGSPGKNPAAAASTADKLERTLPNYGNFLLARCHSLVPCRHVKRAQGSPPHAPQRAARTARRVLPSTCRPRKGLVRTTRRARGDRPHWLALPPPSYAPCGAVFPGIGNMGPGSHGPNLVCGSLELDYWKPQ